MTTRKRHTPEQVTLIGVSLSPGAGVRAWRRDRCHGNWAGYVEAGRQGGGVSCVTLFTTGVSCTVARALEMAELMRLR